MESAMKTPVTVLAAIFVLAALHFFYLAAVG
jgi:hypothetical protein